MTELNETGILDNLVMQFSSPLDCFRELVQNSTDAGSATVEVWAEYVPGESFEGTIAIHVDDYGEGMDEKIIETYFTRLFASAKGDDLTKIGKFGIGFVSVFALNPRAVVVRTGRSGECWQVSFDEQRTFTSTRLQGPVEGTQITLLMDGDVHRYAELMRGIRKSLKHWCNHSTTEVTFEDRTPIDGRLPEVEAINAAFEVEGRFLTHASFPDTEIVAAYAKSPVYGFYNRGLTLALGGDGESLLGERAGRFERISFKIKSRYLEHTLTRESVIQDANFEKAMALLEEAAAGALFEALVEAIEELVARPRWGFREVEAYGELIDYLSREPGELLTRMGDRALVRLVDGQASTLNQMYGVWRRDRRLLVSRGPSALTDALTQAGVPVLVGGVPRVDQPQNQPRRPLDHVAILARNFFDYRERRRLLVRSLRLIEIYFVKANQWPITTPEAVFMPVKVDTRVPEEARGLVEDTARLLEGAGVGLRGLSTCRLISTDGASPLAAVGRRLEGLIERTVRPGVGSRMPRFASLEVAINRDHAHFQSLLHTYQREPGLAATSLAQNLTWILRATQSTRDLVDHAALFEAGLDMESTSEEMVT